MKKWFPIIKLLLAGNRTKGEFLVIDVTDSCDTQCVVYK